MAIKASNQITITDITDAYSVILTSEAFTFIGGTSGAASGSSCSTQAVAYCGTNQCNSVNVTQSAIKFYKADGTQVTSGINATVSNSGTSAVTITFALTAVLNQALEADIPVVVDGITVHKKFSLSVAKTGQQGNPGTSVTVSSVSYAYQLSTSGTTVPTGTWSDTPVAPTTTQYAWTRTTTKYSDNTTAVTYTVGGKVGQQGNPGQNGTSPTVTNTKTQYQKSTSGTTVPTGTWSDTALAPDVNNYVWTKTTITYSDGATAVTYAVAGKQGQQGNAGKDAISVSVVSSNGTVFKNNSGSTVLTAEVYQGGVKKTVNASTGVVDGSLGTIKWYKGAPADTQPTGFPKAAGTLTVQASDVANIQAYTCQLEG